MIQWFVSLKWWLDVNASLWRERLYLCILSQYVFFFLHLSGRENSVWSAQMTSSRLSAPLRPNDQSKPHAAEGFGVFFSCPRGVRGLDLDLGWKCWSVRDFGPDWNIWLISISFVQTEDESDFFPRVSPAAQTSDEISLYLLDELAPNVVQTFLVHWPDYKRILWLFLPGWHLCSSLKCHERHQMGFYVTWFRQSVLRFMTRCLKNI